MTAACNGGPSQIIPGTQEIQNLGYEAIVSALVSAEIDWLAIIASAIPYLVFDLTGMCTRDPPPYPTPDAARYAGYFNPLNPQGANQLRADVQQALTHFLWNVYCQCVTGPTPGPGPPPPAPPGVAVNNPTGTQPTGGTPCVPEFDRGTTITWDANNSFYDTFGGNFGTTSLANVTWGQIAFDTDVPEDFPIVFTIEWRASATAPILSTEQFTLDVQDIPLGKTKFTVHPDPNALGILWHGHREGTGNATSQVSYKMQLFCGTAPLGTDQPCCPPDPTVTNMLNAIIQNEELILSMLGVHNAYTRGTRHSGLTGSGTLNVTGLFGVLVELTTGVPTTPLLPGVPPYQFSVGWISCLTGDGMIDEIRITRQAQVWGSRLAPFATQFGYQLNDGFTADITELLPA